MSIGWAIKVTTDIFTFSSNVSMKILSFNKSTFGAKLEVQKMENQKTQQMFFFSTVNYAARLIGCVKPGEIWQLTFWIWILQVEENYVRIQYSMKKVHTVAFILCGKVFIFLHIAHSRFASAYHFLAFPKLILYRIAF